ncbi:MAG: hypothetical protein COY40_02160 [Alphaproteobacteria bacterium CG_4_10_14_0_8_um_filter_53_9]|nr:MAG: hypothetical protein COY40_02160 [Alphaproteobacteria bacterium CG_4_10_14_0_8_um_filter_53_9]
MHPLPADCGSFTAGIGLRYPHVAEILERQPKVGFLEAHSENYFGGGYARRNLLKLRETYPITLHGVGLSLGRADGLDQKHLRQLKRLVDEVQPLFVSEHLSWSAYTHIAVPDLLPIPFTREALSIFVAHVNEMQDTLGRQVLIENPSNYLAFAQTDWTETEFLNRLAHETGCGLLMDVNNIDVSAHNLGYDAVTYLQAINPRFVKQIHLAGYTVDTVDGTDIRIDTHGNPVYPEGWRLYRTALEHFGDTPTLIEWDTDIPALDVLVAEAAKADTIRTATHAHAEAAHA